MREGGFGGTSRPEIIRNFHFTHIFWCDTGAGQKESWIVPNDMPHCTHMRFGTFARTASCADDHRTTYEEGIGRFINCRNFHTRSLVMSDDSIKKMASQADFLTIRDVNLITLWRLDIFASVKTIKFSSIRLQDKHLPGLAKCHTLIFKMCLYITDDGARVLQTCKQIHFIHCNIATAGAQWLRDQGVDVVLVPRA